MNLVFFSNVLNHHQVIVADELYALLGAKFHFVVTQPRSKWNMKGGEDYSSRPYCICVSNNVTIYNEIVRLARESDVCVFGACSQEYAVERASQKNCGLSFEMGERWLKRGWLNVFSPRLLNWWWKYQRYYSKKPFYKLCAGAFTASDDKKLFAYRGRHYKWGYFVHAETNFQVEDEKPDRISHPKVVTLMWCSRFLKWKHPELPILLAKHLKDNGYRFVVDMYGSGEELEKMQTLVKSTHLDDVVKFKGCLPNQDILLEMRRHDIFLFTSDKNEGWGVVANEAMVNGCVLVASDSIGSVPYLIKDKENGCVFKTCDLDSLVKGVEWLINNPSERIRISENGSKTIRDIWSPQNAAKNLLQLIQELMDNGESSIKFGPCSKA